MTESSARSQTELGALEVRRVGSRVCRGGSGGDGGPPPWQGAWPLAR